MLPRKKPCIKRGKAGGHVGDGGDLKDGRKLTEVINSDTSSEVPARGVAPRNLVAPTATGGRREKRIAADHGAAHQFVRGISGRSRDF